MKKLLILSCLLILSACSSTSTKIEKVDVSKIKDQVLVQKHENTFIFSKYQVANTNYQIQKQNECDTKDFVYALDHQYSKYFLNQINKSTLAVYQYQNNDCQLIKHVNNVAHYNQAIFFEDKLYFDAASSDDQDTSMFCDLDYQTCYQSNILSVLDNKHLLISDQQDHVYLTTIDFSVKEKILNDNDNFISSISTNKYFELIPVNPKNNNDKKIIRYTYK